MSYIRDTAIVLNNEPFREHDAWITLYGERHGKMTAVARGARRMQAKALGHLEPLAEVEVMIAKGAAFDKVAVAHLLRPRLALRSRLGALAVAGALADLIDRLTHPEAGDSKIYTLLLETLDVAEGLTREPSSERGRLMLAGASLKLLDVLGYAPRFENGETTLAVQVLRLLRFMRERPLKELLNITAPPQLFATVSQAVESALAEAPLHAEPHGPRTVTALLS